MESPQSVVSPFKNSSVFPEPEKQNLDLFTKNPNFIPKKPESFLGVLEVYIHQAREIQNICIYHKQDVYAKICITSNPEESITTQIINGGGKNPIFNETLKINVPTIDSSLKCEIFMLSRVRNYLEDQLLGFALIPLTEILAKNGKKLEKEFTLSSTDLFHSPSGFVDLSLSYNGSSPDVISIPPPPGANGTKVDSELSDFEKIEFPDPKLVNENDMMVSEYFNLGSDTDDQIGQTDQISQTDETDETGQTDQIGAPVLETLKPESPPSVSTNESQCANQESFDRIKKPIVAVNIDVDQKVVQQDFVDLYMKSMQQFTESLAKMKLPLDVEKEGTDSGNSSSDTKIQTPNSTHSRVFYGSRAFF